MNSQEFPGSWKMAKPDTGCAGVRGIDQLAAMQGGEEQRVVKHPGSALEGEEQPHI